MNAETRAALALQERGLSTTAIERSLDLLALSPHASEVEVESAIESLAADLPQLFAGRSAAPGGRSAKVTPIDAKRRKVGVKSAKELADERFARTQAPLSGRRPGPGGDAA